MREDGIGVAIDAGEQRGDGGFLPGVEGRVGEKGVDVLRGGAEG